MSFCTVISALADYPLQTAPVWVYCKQANHCRQGMVLAINAPSTGNTFDAFLANAKGGVGAPPAPSGSQGPNPSDNGAASMARSVGVLVAVVAVAAGSLL